MTFEYSNLNDRSPGWFLRLARRLLPGVGLVENEIKPYAAAWHERNLEALASLRGRRACPGPLPSRRHRLRGDRRRLHNRDPRSPVTGRRTMVRSGKSTLTMAGPAGHSLVWG